MNHFMKYIIQKINTFLVDRIFRKKKLVIGSVNVKSCNLSCVALLLDVLVLDGMMSKTKEFCMKYLQEHLFYSQSFIQFYLLI